MALVVASGSGSVEENRTWVETNFALLPDEDKRLELAADQVVNVRSYTENMSHLFANYCSLSVWCSCLFEARQCLSVEQ